MKIIDPDKLKIGYIILIATRKLAIAQLQRKAGYGDSSKWTHVAGSIGCYDTVEAAVPKSRVVNLQKEYVDRGIEIKVMRRKGQNEHKRYKIALWWATMKGNDTQLFPIQSRNCFESNRESGCITSEVI